jgi:hypothetical protein
MRNGREWAWRSVASEGMNWALLWRDELLLLRRGHTLDPEAMREPGESIKRFMFKPVHYGRGGREWRVFLE